MPAGNQAAREICVKHFYYSTVYEKDVTKVVAELIELFLELFVYWCVKRYRYVVSLLLT